MLIAFVMRHWKGRSNPHARTYTHLPPCGNRLRNPNRPLIWCLQEDWRRLCKQTNGHHNDNTISLSLTHTHTLYNNNFQINVIPGAKIWSLTDGLCNNCLTHTQELPFHYSCIYNFCQKTLKLAWQRVFYIRGNVFYITPIHRKRQTIVRVRICNWRNLIPKETRAHAHAHAHAI